MFWLEPIWASQRHHQRRPQRPHNQLTHPQEAEEKANHPQEVEEEANHLQEAEEEANHPQEAEGEANHPQEAEGEANHPQEVEEEANHPQEGHSPRQPPPRRTPRPSDCVVTPQKHSMETVPRQIDSYPNYIAFTLPTWEYQNSNPGFVRSSSPLPISKGPSWTGGSKELSIGFRN
jgi:hypothetical protein